MLIEPLIFEFKYFDPAGVAFVGYKL